MSLLKEFKEFATKGNVLDMAVGVIVGSTFSAIVNSLVNDIFMPVIGAITGGINIAGLSITVGIGETPAVIAYGAFLNAIVNFLIVAFILFMVVKSMNQLKKLTEKPAVVEEPKPARVCPFCKMEIADDATRCPHCTSELN